MSRPGRKPVAGDLPSRIGARAGNLFATRQMHCSEAVLVTLNRSLGGSLQPHQALALAAPFSEGVGRSGCMCGALGGGLMALGLLIGGSQPLRRRGAIRQAAERLTSEFKRAAGGPCCRIVSRRTQAGSTRFERCTELTALGAALAAAIILEDRPGLAESLDPAFIRARDSLPAGLIRRALRCAGCRL